MTTPDPQPGPVRTTGRCSVCGRGFRLKKDGTVHHHTNQNAERAGGIFAPVCVGAGRKPKEQS